MEVLNVALNGKYKDGYELGHVGEIIIGNIKWLTTYQLVVTYIKI